MLHEFCLFNLKLLFLMQIKIVSTERGPHLWPKRLPLQISMVITKNIS